MALLSILVAPARRARIFSRWIRLEQLLAQSEAQNCQAPATPVAIGLRESGYELPTLQNRAEGRRPSGRRGELLPVVRWNMVGPSGVRQSVEGRHPGSAPPS